ncbi:hypothetical protein DRE43_19200 [Salmonella enterica subsp. enterica serovar Java]|uniref:DUF6750 family protein n=1 Tax=Salmonella enterica TaxID=28901 RepID=UPI001284B721|nr:hypothetical protein [Salmonella enterica]EBX2066759.1 hypothetical protein [Salmonella enterica subsp. enterica serovar Java]ECA1939645.1 hypothetical protein [Salmonella enterica subsp. enterica serovar Enteritidis]ECC9066982.1 hypothetical protein [Salmonella enterica subsp. diarizonae]ECY5112793.1 hypothetical protein [Salmonella enterica subsp. enterica serovar Typhimurium]EDQ4604250.1 hypothetical protein [Salmonella enterica subsp. arizonae]EGO1766426.1 hypothetical protein [Salmone
MNTLKNIMLRIAVEFSLRAWQLRRRTSLWLSGLVLGALASQPAYAAGDDLAAMVKSFLGFFTDIKQPLLDAAPVVGIIFIILALLMMRWKKNNPNIKPWEIAVLFGIGLFLLALNQIVSRGQKQMGLNPVGF